jgi:hypothetical protein
MNESDGIVGRQVLFPSGTDASNGKSILTAALGADGDLVSIAVTNLQNKAS